MIPKQIHYFWFGDAQKSELLRKCLKSWEQHLPEYKIIEWNESNYDVTKNAFTLKAFSEKKWAFLSDYARLDVLSEHGGIYLDTDMEIIRPLDPLLSHGSFIGMESATHANASIVGAVANHWFIQEVLDSYTHTEPYVTIPVKVTAVLQKYIPIKDKQQNYRDVFVFPHEYFYPFSFTETFNPNCLTENTYSIHWWDHSWGSKKAKVLKKLGLLRFAQWAKGLVS